MDFKIKLKMEELWDWDLNAKIMEMEAYLPTVLWSGLSSNTAYTFTVKAKDAAGNTSANSNAVNVTTLQGSGGGTTTELLISEYVEGSSYNKALEVVNFTGASVDLSIYKIKKQISFFRTRIGIVHHMDFRWWIRGIKEPSLLCSINKSSFCAKNR